MVLFRPKRSSYNEAMKELCIKPDMSAIDDLCISQIEHREWSKRHQDAILIRVSDREFNDNRNGWQHSRFIYKGTEIIGIIDHVTFADFHAPVIQIRSEDDDSYTAFVSFAGEEFIFCSGLGLWSEKTQCIGYIGNEFGMRRQIFRQDNIEISENSMLNIIYKFICCWASKLLRQKNRSEKKMR